LVVSVIADSLATRSSLVLALSPQAARRCGGLGTAELGLEAELAEGA